MFSLCLSGQQTPPSPVGYTEAREYHVESQLRLPGTVSSGVTSLVASEIAGLVVEYPVKEGDTVRKGQLLARVNQHSLKLELRAARAQLQEAEARRKLARRNFERAEELFTAKVFSQQQFDDARYEFNAWQGRVGNLEAEIERIEYDIQRSGITAPFDGVVVAKRTELGQWLGVGDPVVELLSLAALEVVVDVPEQYYPSVRIGGPARLTLDALPGRTLRGKVSAIIPRADEEARTFPVKVSLSAGTGRISVGMLAHVLLEGVSASGGRAHSATIIPKDGLYRQGDQLIVYRIGEDGTVEPVPVTTGAGAGAWIEVRGGISPGERVVTRGNERLRPGQRVRGEPVEYPLP